MDGPSDSDSLDSDHEIEASSDDVSDADDQDTGHLRKSKKKAAKGRTKKAKKGASKKNQGPPASHASGSAGWTETKTKAFAAKVRTVFVCVCVCVCVYVRGLVLDVGSGELVFFSVACVGSSF
jgi:hypothetical protein